MHSNFSILYVDENIVVVDKPSGLRTIPDGYNQDLPNLKELLKKEFGEIWTVHRLDKDTSGVIIFARNRLTHQILNTYFEKRYVEKTYIAITHHIPAWDKISIDASLKINGDRRHRTVISKNGKSAVTLFQKESENSSLNIAKIKAFPKTGYTHQIRAHLAHAGFPILNDSLYHKPSSLTPNEIFANKKVGRFGLHAFSIRIRLFEGEDFSEFQAKIPIEFNIFKKK